jgi:hypothetical protein
MGRFVWVEGMQGPTPELWSDDYKNDDSQGKPRKIVLQSHDLMNDGHEAMSLDGLARKYPLEQRNAV